MYLFDKILTHMFYKSITMIMSNSYVKKIFYTLLIQKLCTLSKSPTTQIIYELSKIMFIYF